MPTSGHEFGRRVRELREAKRKHDPAFSLRRFAQTVGISAAYLSKVEMGEALPPKADNIKKMASLLNTNADELLALAGKVDPLLHEIIRDYLPTADLLRTVREVNPSDEEIEAITRKLKKINSS